MATTFYRFWIFLGFFQILTSQRSPIDYLISKYKERRIRLREDVYFNNLPILAEYDFIIVGAGPAGCVLANRLSENPDVSVLLLEAGVEENIYVEVPALSTYLLFSEYNWKYKSQFKEGTCLGSVDQRCTWPSGKGIGGGTIINAMMFTRGNRRDFDRWVEAGNPGWGYDAMLPYFRKSEDMQIPELRDSPYHGKEGPLTLTQANYKSPFSNITLQSALELGYNVVDYNAPGSHVGFSRIQFTIRDGKRCSAAKAFLEPAHLRPNLHIAQKAQVTRIVIDPISKVTIGVEFVKKETKRFVRARKEVIVSAGAFNSPQLLMLSGIGPRDHLREMGIPVIVDLPVGENLQEHAGTSALTFTVDKGIVPDFVGELRALPVRFIEWQQTGGTTFSSAGCEVLGYVKSTYADPGDSPDIELIQVFASFASDQGANLRKNYDIRDDVYNAVYRELQGKPTLSLWVIGMYPNSRGSVKLASKNPFDPPLIYTNFFNDTQDLDVIVQGIKHAISLTKTKAMEAAGIKLHDKKLPNCEQFEFGSDEYWQCFVRELTSQFHHQSGTCKMGPPNDPTAVVDPRLRVYGVSGLRVVDTSIMPTITGGHTQSPAYAIGEKAADLIKEDYNYLL